MKMQGNSRLRTMLALTALALVASSAEAMLDPSGVYCTSLGYRFVVEKSDGGYVGYCQISDTQKVDAWKFLKGEVAKESNACTKKGYMMKTIKDDARCWFSDNGQCSACVLADGSEVEVTQLMNLSFLESKCGDGICGMPETYLTCPNDCPSGGADTICDGVKDGRCDPDCEIQDKDDTDCSTTTTVTQTTQTTLKPAPPRPTTTLPPAPLRPTTTLPPTKPLNQQNDTSCIPLLLAPIAMIAAAAGKAMRLI